MVGLHSAIREQRRDKKSVSSEVAELDSVLLDVPLTDKSDPFNSSLQEFEDLDFIDDWICEPDCFEMADAQTNFDKDVAAAKEINERKVVGEECSPISFTIETEGASPSDVDNVGAMIGEVFLDGDGGILSEHTYFEHSIAQNECPDAKNGCPDGKSVEQIGNSECAYGKIECSNANRGILSDNTYFEHSVAQNECPDVKNGCLHGKSVVQTETSGCGDGKIERPHGSCSLSEKDRGISTGMPKNVTSSGVSVTGSLPRPKEECVEYANSVKRTWNNMEMSVLEKSDANLDWYRGFEQPIDNLVKTEEFPRGESHNVANKGNDLSEIWTPGATPRSDEEHADNTSLIHRTGSVIPQRNILKNCGIGLDEHRGFESAGADSQCPSCESEETLMETSKSVTICGNGVSALSITGHNEGLTNSVQAKNEVKEFKNTKVSRIDYSDVESGEIVSEDDAEECTGLMKPDCEDCIDMVEPDREHCIDMMEPDGEGCAGMVEPDSDYCSDSLLDSADSDYSEEHEYVEGEEEGEIKHDKGRRKLQAGSLDYDFGSSDEEVPKGPIRSKHELEDLPPVPPVNVVLESHHQTQPAGVIASVLGTSIVVEGRECHTPLNEGTILWIQEKRLPLGFIDEVFGPVKSPFYLVRFNTVNDVPDFVKEGVHVSYVPQFASYVLNDPNLYKKGYDASGDNDEELSEEAEFSDDEKEAGYKREKLNAKRGAKSTQNIQEKNSCRVRKKPEFVDFRKNKFGHNRFQQNANYANGRKGRAQEVKFAYKKPFENSYHNGPHVSRNQAKDCSRPGVSSFQHVPQLAQSQGINHTQKSSQHLDHQGGFVKQAAIRSTESGNPRPGLHFFNGVPSSHGRMTGGIRPMHPSFVAGKSLSDGDYKANSSTSDPLGQTPPVQHHNGTLHDPMGQTSPGQSQFRPLCGPAQGFHPAAMVNLGQPPGGPMPNGQQTNVNHMGFPPMPVHPAFLGQPAQNSSIQQAMAFMAWNVGRSNHVAGGSQLLPSNANHGAGNSLNFNQMHPCVGIPVLQQPGLYTNMGALPGHNLTPCPMPWGQQTIPQGNPSHLPSQNPSIPFSQPNNISGTRPPHPSQAAKDN